MADGADVVADAVRWTTVIEMVDERVLVASGDELEAILGLIGKFRQQWPHLPRTVQRRNAVYLQLFAVCGLASAPSAGSDGTSERQSATPPSDWITTSQAAELIDWSESYVRRQVGKLGGRWYRGQWYFDPQQVVKCRRRDETEDM